jgi:hypothetical protein
MQARMLKKTQQKPADGSTHWSCRKMAAATGLSPATSASHLDENEAEATSTGPLHGQQ